MKVLELLSMSDYRGLDLKNELAKRFGMSSQTYQNSRKELLERKQIELIKIKPQGKNYLYKITERGSKELSDFKSNKSEYFDRFNIKREFPFIFSGGKKGRKGFVDVEVFSTTARRDQLLHMMLNLTSSSEFNRIIKYLIDKDLNEQFLVGRDNVLDPNYHVDVGIKLNIQTDIPKKLLVIIRLINELLELERKWYVERNLLFEQFYRRALKNKQASEFLCSIDFFYSRPESLFECLVINGAVLTSDGKYERQMVRRDYKTEPAYYKYAFTDSLSLFLFSKFKWPLLDNDIKREALKEWEEWLRDTEEDYDSYYVQWPQDLYKQYPRYQPNYKIKVRRKIFDFSRLDVLSEIKKISEDPEVTNWWEKTKKESESKLWFTNYRSPFLEMVLDKTKEELSVPFGREYYEITLVDYETADTSDLSERILLLSVLFTTGKNRVHRTGLTRNAWLWYFLKDEATRTDQEWFKAWPYFLSELKKRPVSESSFLIEPFDDLYNKWILSNRPKKPTYHIRKILFAYVLGLKSKNSEYSLHPKTRNKLRDKIFNIVYNATF